jgi:phage antirepressor YoqD-like protein
MKRMNELKLVVENGKLVADSREVAEMIGKDHAHLCRDIAGYVEVISQNPKLDSDGNNPKLDSSSGDSTNPKLGALTNPKLDLLDFFMPSTYVDKKGESRKCYKLTKQGCEMVANKLTGKKGIMFTAVYVQRFNDMEKELSRPHDSYMIADPVERALKWAEEEKVRQEQAKLIEEAKPKALFADAVASSSTSILIRDLAKVLHQNGIKIGQNRMFDWLRDHGYLIKRGSDKNMPTQRAMELKLFHIKEGTYIDSNGNNITTKTPKVTGKGQIYFVNKFLSA